MEAKIAKETQAIKKIKYNSKYVSIHFGLTEEQAKKLENFAEEKNITESAVLRQIIDVYLFNLGKKPLVFLFKKFSPIGLLRLPRTIRSEQDMMLRKIAAKIGKKKSELVRDAVERFT